MNPKPFLYWTNAHPIFDELGVLAVGRLKIPLRLILVIVGALTVPFIVFGLVGTGVLPWIEVCLNRSPIDPSICTNTALQADPSWFIYLGMYLLSVLALASLVGVILLIGWAKTQLRLASNF